MPKVDQRDMLKWNETDAAAHGRECAKAKEKKLTPADFPHVALFYAYEVAFDSAKPAQG